MKKHRFKVSGVSLAGLCFALAPQAAKACAVCMGADENTGEALNGAIFAMLGFIGAMLALISAVAFTFWRRSHSAAASSLPSDLILEKL